MKKILLTILFAALFVLAAPRAKAAILYSGAGNQVVYEGESFVVEWLLDTQDDTVNTLDMRLAYSKDTLEAINVSAADSDLDLWVKTPVVDNDKGTIDLIGGITSGIKSSKLHVFRAVFKPKQVGSGVISMDNKSQVLLADGEGTPTSLIFNELRFAVNPADAKPASISSPSHPDQDKWYKNQNVQITLEPKEGEEYSYSFSSNLEIFPDQTPDPVDKPIQYKDLADGIYYFKLNSRVGPSNWQEAGVFRVQIDTTPPGQFQSALAKDNSVFDGKPFISFAAKDSVSGISHYEVKTGPLGKWEKTEDNVFQLSGLILGDRIDVKVVDEAGNEAVKEIKVDRTIVNSVFSNLIFWAIIIISLIAVIWAVRFYFKLLQKYKIK